MRLVVVAFVLAGLAFNATAQPATSAHQVPVDCPTNLQELRSEACKSGGKIASGGLALEHFLDLTVKISNESDQYPKCPRQFFMDPCSYSSIANARPGTPFPAASELIPKCEIAVRFNENEKSVPEKDYLDGMFCMGLMEGILGTNSALPAGKALFCSPGMKTWIAAKIIVEHAKQHPDQLLQLNETEFSITALKTKYPCRWAN